MHENEISQAILGAAFRVHTALGCGLMEAVYEAALAHELKKQGLRIETQVTLPVFYDGIRLDVGYRIDMLVEDKVVVELKSVEALVPIHSKQLTNYLKLSHFKLGLLLNFNVGSLREGIVRIVNRL